MKAYALIGESGSGKSYNSITIAAKYGLNYIVDDDIIDLTDDLTEAFDDTRDEFVETEE